MLSTIQLPRPFQIIIDDLVLETLQTYSGSQEKSLILFNNYINSNTLSSGNIKFDFEFPEIFRQMIFQEFLLIFQREVFVQKWANVEYSVEEYAGDVTMGDGDNDSVSNSTHHQPINDTMQRSNYSAVLKVSRTIAGQEDDKAASYAYTSKDNCRLPPTLAAYGRCTRSGGGGVSRRYSMGFARSRSSSKL